MNNLFRALIAGYGAKKLGGGCLGTIVVFIVIWVALGQCSWTSSRAVPPPQTYPSDRMASIATGRFDERVPPSEIQLGLDEKDPTQVSPCRISSPDICKWIRSKMNHPPATETKAILPAV